jgi:hypothetical protein
MKLNLKIVALTAGLSALLGTAILSAQGTTKAVANIPFAYKASGTNLSAGTYRISDAGTHGQFMLRDANTGNGIFVMGVPDKTTGSDASKLTFSCYAGQCSLSEIWIQGDSYKLSLPRVEREASNRLGVAALVSVPLLSR